MIPGCKFSLNLEAVAQLTSNKYELYGDTELISSTRDMIHYFFFVVPSISFL